MAQITYKQHDGTEHVVEVEPGTSAMQGALNNDISGIVAECGGGMACATCHVYVDDAWVEKLPETDEMENQMLDCVAAERRVNSRLSCQVNITDEVDGMIIRIPDTQY